MRVLNDAMRRLKHTDHERRQIAVDHVVVRSQPVSHRSRPAWTRSPAMNSTSHSARPNRVTASSVQPTSGVSAKTDTPVEGVHLVVPLGALRQQVRIQEVGANDHDSIWMRRVTPSARVASRPLRHGSSP